MSKRPAYQPIAKRTARYLLAMIEHSAKEARESFVQRLGEPDYDYETRINDLTLASIKGMLRSEARRT